MDQSSAVSRLWMKLLMTCYCSCNHLFLSTVLHISVDFHYSKAQKGARCASGLSVIKKVPPFPCLNSLPFPLLLCESSLRQTPFAVMLDVFLLQSSQVQICLQIFWDVYQYALKMLLIYWKYWTEKYATYYTTV